LELKGTPTIWTTQFSEAEMKCPPGHFMAGIKCEESFCKKKELLCAQPKGDKWLVVGEPYYSHCFTNKLKQSWLAWFRGMGEWIRGRSRMCVGEAANNMPDKQSCGQDGIIVGIRCYGKECDRLQLLCATVDAQVDLNTGAVASSQVMKVAMSQQALFDDPSAWSKKPSSDKPASNSVWDGATRKSSNPLLDGIVTDAALNLQPPSAMLLTVAMLVMVCITSV